MEHQLMVKDLHFWIKRYQKFDGLDLEFLYSLRDKLYQDI